MEKINEKNLSAKYHKEEKKVWFQEKNEYKSWERDTEKKKEKRQEEVDGF